MSEEAINYMKNSFHSSLQWLQLKMQSLNTDEENAMSSKQGGMHQNNKLFIQRSKSQVDGYRTRLATTNTTRPDDTTSRRDGTTCSELHNRKKIEIRRHSYSIVVNDIEGQRLDKSTGLLNGYLTRNTKKAQIYTGHTKGSAKSTISHLHTGSTDSNRMRLPKNYSSDENSVSGNSRRLDNEFRRALYRIKYNRNDVGAGSMGRFDTDSLNDNISLSSMITQRYKRLNEYNFSAEPCSLNPSNIYGEIKIMFQFFHEENDLHVTLLKATNVAQNQDGALGVYAKVCLMPGEIQKKVRHDKQNTHNPVFCEPFRYRMTLEELFGHQIKVKLYNKPGKFSRSEAIGECSISLRQYDPTAITVIWQNLKESKTRQNVK